MCPSLILLFRSYGDQAGRLEEGQADLTTCLENINPQTMKVLNYHWKKTLGHLLKGRFGRKQYSPGTAGPERCNQKKGLFHSNRNYWTPAKMSRFGLRESDKCWRCSEERGTLVHRLYGCEMVHSFWAALVQFINNVTKTEFSEGPSLCVFSTLSRRTGLSPQMCPLVKLALVTGSRK